MGQSSSRISSDQVVFISSRSFIAIPALLVLSSLAGFVCSSAALLFLRLFCTSLTSSNVSGEADVCSASALPMCGGLRCVLAPGNIRLIYYLSAPAKCTSEPYAAVALFIKPSLISFKPFMCISLFFFCGFFQQYVINQLVCLVWL